jgi:hypothetical protein
MAVVMMTRPKAGPITHLCVRQVTLQQPCRKLRIFRLAPGLVTCRQRLRNDSNARSPWYEHRQMN